MGEAKRKRAVGFDRKLVSEWEANRCVNFACALARKTGWLLHVDWLGSDLGQACLKTKSPPVSPPVEEMVPLRAYVGDDNDAIFDLRGTFSIIDFVDRVINPLARVTGRGYCGVFTKMYDEDQVIGMRNLLEYDEIKVEEALTFLGSNCPFTKFIPVRQTPCLPAKAAATHAWGRCAVYAEALSAFRNALPVALIIEEHKNYAGLSSIGYTHSFCVYPDGTGEDSWGRFPIQRIANRYHANRWYLNAERHQTVVRNMREEDPSGYEKAYLEADTLIRMYC